MSMSTSTASVSSSLASSSSATAGVVHPNAYNPISNLDKQYAYPPLGRRCTLFISLNESCLPPGGVETVLRHTSSKNASQEWGKTGDDGEDVSIVSSSSSSLFDTMSTAEESQQQEDVDTTATKVKANPKNWGSKLAHFAKNTQQHIERKVTSLAIQAQQKVNVAASGESQKVTDLLSVGVYLQNSNTGEYDICLGMTESQDILNFISHSSREEEDSTHDMNPQFRLNFQIPVFLPPHLFFPDSSPNQHHGKNSHTNTSWNGLNIQFRLWIRSSATFVSKTYFTVGMAILRIPTLVQVVQALISTQHQQQQQQHMQPTCKIITLPLQSTLVTGGKISLFLLSDFKFTPQLGGLGWSLSDPSIPAMNVSFLHSHSHHNLSTMMIPNAADTGRKRFFNPPLDQSFLFPSQPCIRRNRSTPTTLIANTSTHDHGTTSFSTFYIATERATESTLILPLAIAYHRLLVDAATISTSHASSLTQQLRLIHNDGARTDPVHALQNGRAQCQLDICHFMAQYSYPSSFSNMTSNNYNNNNNNNNNNSGILMSDGGTIPVLLSPLSSKTMVSIYLQRPDCIFEDILTTGQQIPKYPYNSTTNFVDIPTSVSLSIPFYPMMVPRHDKRLSPMELMAEGNSQRSIFLGSIRMEFGREEAALERANFVGSPDNSRNGGIFEAILDMEPFMDFPNSGFVQIPVRNIRTGENVGLLICRLQIRIPSPLVIATKYMPSHEQGIHGGLHSFVGLNSLIDDECFPNLDLERRDIVTSSSTLEQEDIRKRKLSTMGEWLRYEYMRTVERERTSYVKDLQERTQAYIAAISPASNTKVDLIPPCKRKDPYPFRPSSSRNDPLLSGIGFNIHVQNFSMFSMTADSSSVSSSLSPAFSFHNVTCGAPADHYRGFGPKGMDGRSAAGGLRRLEAARLAAADTVRIAQDNLIQAVTQYFQNESSSNAGTSKRRVVKKSDNIANLRNDALLHMENFHNLSWEIAIRRGNVFSQALGIAVTSYVAHVSDILKMKAGKWAELWVQHGFLISFEGLLSTAGKELGMIEDASVAISMLRMTYLVIAPDDSTSNTRQSSRVSVPDSPYLRWVDITSSGSGSDTVYRVEIGVDPQYYHQVVPHPLRGTVVRMYPVFFQMGVDIRQWGANAGMRVQASTLAGGSNSSIPTSPSSENLAQDSLENDDDEIGIPDNDVLISLNFEAFRKINAYAHNLVPSPTTTISVTWEDAHTQSQLRQPIHPMLSVLYDLIRGSAGRMEHGVLDKAGIAASKLGGGVAIFCKSGKDRTAMQVTFKQAQFANAFLKGGNVDEIDDNKVLKDASLIRVHGVRLPICEKNVGQSLYAFNSLQVKFMPQSLKPPPQTLAGFLKGGRVFSREGAIES